MKISIVIATMNRPKTLKDALDHLALSSKLPDEIVIVDQSKDSKTKKIVLQYENLNITYKHANPSLTAARNIGIRLATNDVVIMMDDDVNVEKDTILNVSNIMKNEEVSLIAGRNLNSTIKKENFFGYIFFKKRLFKGNCSYVTNTIFGRYPRELKEEINTEWAMGFFFVIRKKLVEQFDCFWDEKLESYAYPEDLDFSYRYFLKSQENNYKCIMSPKVQVYHMASKEFRETSWKTTLMYVINREYLSYKFKKNFFHRLMMRWSNFGFFLQRLVCKDNPLDVLKAQFYCDFYRKDIKKGVLHTELYNKY